MKRLSFRVILLVLVLTAGAFAPDTPSRPTSSTPRQSIDLRSLPAAQVLRIIDGDTIVVLCEGKKTVVRLIGVDTPESVHPRRPVEPYAKEASAFTASLLAERSVVLALPSRSRDRYHRTLAYVFRLPDGLLVNAEIIRQGLGRAYTRYPFQYKTEFLQLEDSARREGSGLWSLPSPEASTLKK